MISKKVVNSEMNTNCKHSLLFVLLICLIPLEKITQTVREEYRDVSQNMKNSSTETLSIRYTVA